MKKQRAATNVRLILSCLFIQHQVMRCMRILYIVTFFACSIGGLLFALAPREPVVRYDDEIIALYNFGPSWAEEEKRVTEILDSHHIVYDLPNSAQVMVTVSSAQAAEARMLLAQAILKEHLRLSLVKHSPASGTMTEIDPKDIVGPSPSP